jgi:type II secretory pathway component GspD/PulD (secretin)
MKRTLAVFFILVSLYSAFSQEKQSTPSTSEQSTSTSSDQRNLYPIDKIPVPDSITIPVLDFKNTDIRDVLRALGMQYNVNIFLEPDVTGAVSLYLTNVSVKSAIDFIVKRSNYVYTIENGIVKVFKFVTPPPPPPVKPPVVFHLKDGLLDIDVKAVDVRELARAFSDSTGINVIVDGSIDKQITARLVKMKPEKAISTLFESNGLAVTSSDGIFYVSNQTWGNDKTANTNATRRLSITVKDQKVSLEVDNAPLDQVARTIANQSGINIVIYDKLTGDISAKFSSIPIDDALRFLLQNTKFTFWKEKEIYFIGSREMNQQKTTIIIPLKHIMAEEAAISKMLPPSISTNAVVKYNTEHNSIVLIGSSDVVAQAQEFIEKIDKPVAQVLIEALVVDFNVNKIRDLGVSMFTQGVKDTGGNWLSETFLPSLDLKPGKQKTEKILTSVMNFIGVDQIVKLPGNFRTAIQALENVDVVKVHSTPQIATLNGNAASITIGETRYYKLQKETKAANDNNSTVIGTDERFEVMKFNTQLQVTPWVMDKGYVTVKIRPEFNIPRSNNNSSIPPNVDTRVIESMVRLRDGQTIILGGQRQTSEVVSRRGIPFLSSIPGLGLLFSSKNVTKNETQMMIFLTPHVYYGDDNAVSPDDYFGKEVNKILDKYGLDKNAERIKKSKISETDSTAVSTNDPEKSKKKKKRKLHWPWKKDDNDK